MRRKLLTLILIMGAALLVACGSGNAEPAAAPAENQSAPDASVSGASGDTGDAGDAQAESSAAGKPKFVEFYADW